MKNLIIASLLLGSAAYASASSGGMPPQKKEMSAAADASPARRSMGASASLTLINNADCRYCTDVGFIFAAQDAIDSCPNQLRTLQSRLDSGIEPDSAWSTFCTGTCAAQIAKIDDDYRCCLGDYAALAMNVRHMCSRSTAGRYCGADLSNLNNVNCTAATSTSCVARKVCQWDAAASTCYFGGDTATINGVCSECNTKYFTQFFAGGIFEPHEHAKLAGVYANFCTMVNGTSSYATAASLAFRLPDEMSTTDVTSRICGGTDLSRRNKLSLRANTVHITEGMRRKALLDWRNCPYGTAQNDIDCRKSLTDVFNQAAAIEASVDNVCSVDSDNGSGFCAAKFSSAFTSAQQCVKDTFNTNQCVTDCASNNRNLLTNLKCCAATYGFNGYGQANTNISTASEAQFHLGKSVYNRTLEATYDWPRDTLSDAQFKNILQTSQDWVTANDGLGIYRSCGSVAAVTAAAQCKALNKYTRHYVIELALDYDALMANTFPEYLNHAFAIDVGAALGVSRLQLQSLVWEPSATALVRKAGKNYRATKATLGISGDAVEDIILSDLLMSQLNRLKNLAFPIFGPELANAAPSSYANRYTSFFKSGIVLPQEGDAPLELKVSQEDIVNRDKEAQEEINKGTTKSNGVSTTATAAAAAVVGTVATALLSVLA